MNYGILTIDTRTSNRGNRLIEYAMKKVLDLPEPMVSVSMFVEPTPVQVEQLNTCKFVLLPGATILAANDQQGKAMRFLDRIKVPKFCCAASGWKPKYKMNVEALKHIDGPIGARDPDTLADCKEVGRDVIMVGCPTAYMPKIHVLAKPPYTVVGFARTHVLWQVQRMKNLACGKLVASVQERTFEVPILKQFTDQAVYYDDPESVYRVYGGASLAVTGRLHGALPAVSQHLPVAFFGDPEDSRFTLLRYLGLTINPLGTDKPFTFDDPSSYVAYVAKLYDAMQIWKQKTIGALR